MAELRARGVVFEHYEPGGPTMKEGIAIGGGTKAEWFKDREAFSRSALRFSVNPQSLSQSARMLSRNHRCAGSEVCALFQLM